MHTESIRENLLNINHRDHNMRLVWNERKTLLSFFFFFIFSKSLPLHLFPTPPLPPSLMLQSRTKGKVKDQLLLIDWKGEGEWKVFFEGGEGSNGFQGERRVESVVANRV